MNKDFLLYPEALALKELGFDEPCLKGFFNFVNTKSEGDITELLSPKINIFGEDYLFRNSIDFIEQPSMAINNHPICNKNCSAPTLSQAFRWFREKHNLTWEHQFDDNKIELYVGEIAYPDNNLDFFKSIEVEYDGYNKAYEEAELKCLKKLIEWLRIRFAIKIIKTNKV